MGLGHEKLDVYRLSIGYVAWVYEKADGLTGNHRSARYQWLRASQSIPLNIAEGNGKTAEADRRRYFEIARGSALECGAIQDVLVVGKALDEQESLVRKTELDRMAAMLSRRNTVASPLTFSLWPPVQTRLGCGHAPTLGPSW